MSFIETPATRRRSFSPGANETEDFETCAPFTP